jgi:hypothetical protein
MFICLVFREMMIVVRINEGQTPVISEIGRIVVQGQPR